MLFPVELPNWIECKRLEWTLAMCSPVGDGYGASRKLHQTTFRFKDHYKEETINYQNTVVDISNNSYIIYHSHVVSIILSMSSCELFRVDLFHTTVTRRPSLTRKLWRLRLIALRCQPGEWMVALTWIRQFSGDLGFTFLYHWVHQVVWVWHEYINKGYVFFLGKAASCNLPASRSRYIPQIFGIIWSCEVPIVLG